MEELHLFDLDGTLWNFDSKIWIIDKNNPGKPIMKLSNKDFKLIKSGIYRKDDILIEYNGKSYYISNLLLEKLQRYVKSLIPERIGFSFIEFIDNKWIKNVKFLIKNIFHLSNNTNINIGFLSGRWDKHKDGKFLNDLRLELKNLNLDLDKIIFVNDYFNYSVNDNTNYQKLNSILEHLIGYKIDKNKFVALKQDKYNSIYFYDDEVSNINICKHIQEYFNELVLNTDDEVYNLIKIRLKESKLKLTTCLLTNNNLNNYKKEQFVLTEPVKFPLKLEKIILKFDQFIKKI